MISFPSQLSRILSSSIRRPTSLPFLSCRVRIEARRTSKSACLPSSRACICRRKAGLPPDHGRTRWGARSLPRLHAKCRHLAAWAPSASARAPSASSAWWPFCFLPPRSLVFPRMCDFPRPPSQCANGAVPHRCRDLPSKAAPHLGGNMRIALKDAPLLGPVKRTVDRLKFVILVFAHWSCLFDARSGAPDRMNVQKVTLAQGGRWSAARGGAFCLASAEAVAPVSAVPWPAPAPARPDFGGHGALLPSLSHAGAASNAGSSERLRTS
jgi:hypothetical protein